MFAWAKKPDHALGLFVYLLFVGFASAALQTTVSYVGHAVLLATMTLAIALVFVAIFGRSRSRWIFMLSGVIVFEYALLDSFFFRLHVKHPTNADALATLDALRTGTIIISGTDKLVLIGVATGACLTWWLLLAGLASLPKISWLDRRETACAGLSLGLLCIFLFFQDLFFQPTQFPVTLFSLHRKDELQRSSMDEASQSELQFNSSLFEHRFGALDDFAQHFPQRFEARETPDILFIHLESLRGSDFGPELFPKTMPLIGNCLRPARHYSTGNATGNGLFGVLHGLSTVYAHLLRERPFAPLPLRVLRKLGYVNHVWFPNQALEFDDLRRRIVGEDVEIHRVNALPVFQADERNVIEYLGRSPSTTPRFDYLVIDSSHYDYSYPPEFEVHKPTGTLGLAFNPLTGEGLQKLGVAQGPRTIEERAKIYNRYKNSLLYIDGLVARLLSEERQTSSRSRLVALFGDHGESFWDGDESFGHSTRLTDAQTRVPFVLCGPGPLHTKHQIGSHADIFPTIFDWMGVVSPAPFMTGKSLLQYDPVLDYAIVRGIVNVADASNQYAVRTPGWRTELTFWNTSRLAWVKNDREEIMANPPRHLIAEAMATLISNTTFRTPVLRPSP